MRRINWILILTLILPTALSVLYYGLIASDVYISESRFVVRNPSRQNTEVGLGALLQGSSFSRSQDDTYSVHDYVLSRDALVALDQELKLRNIFSEPKIDFLNRFPMLAWDKSFESFYLYYQRHVTVDYDSTSSISVLTVRAYTAKDAHDINDALLRMSESLVNNLNERSRQDLIRVAQQEVKEAEDEERDTSAALSSFRSDRNVVDPTAQSALNLQSIAKLEADRVGVDAQLAQLRKVAPSSTQIPSLVAYRDSLNSAISAQSGNVVGGNASLTSKAPIYDRLLLNKTFADKQLGTALASLEQARSEAQRKQLYLERLVEPNLPDEAMEPRRLRAILTVFLLGLIIYAVVSLIVASVKEHTD